MAVRRTGEGANILITGGSDGIGLKLAGLYAAQGANVVITGRRDSADVPENATFHYIEADQRRSGKAARAIVDGLDGLGWQHCDIAILNAGYGQYGPPLDESLETIRQTLAVNLASPIQIAHALAPFLFASRNGQLVLFGSTAHKGAENFASYAATKSGLHGFARSLREEWQGKARVQIIHPGPTRTAMHDKAGFDPGAVHHLFLKPEFVAGRIARLIEKNKSPASISLLANLPSLLTLKHWRAG